MERTRHLIKATCVPPVLLLAALGGCATNGPAFITVEAADYARAFDLAVEAARQAGMPARIQDRRGGVIETGDRIAGSVLEPWRVDNDSFAQALENTMGFQRRRARFEFTPAGFVEPADDPDAPLVGADAASGIGPPFDLTTHDGPVELRAWVYVERADLPGLRRSSWSRRLSSYTTDPERRTADRRPTDRPAAERPADEPARAGRVVTWTPVDRDKAYERRLLSIVDGEMRARARVQDADPE